MEFLLLKDEMDTLQLAKELAINCPQNVRIIVYLKGDLGVGKTTFTRFFLQSLGYQGKIKSPTYNIIETYNLLTWRIFHLDLYRLEAANDLNELGLYDEFDQPILWLIEWPDRAYTHLPPADISLNFSLLDARRQVTLLPQTSLGKQIFQKLKLNSP